MTRESKISAETVLPPMSEYYIRAMERLVGVVQDLSHARDINLVMAIVRKAARELTGADGATFILRDGDFCYYAEENAISPLWKGQRFPMKNCISGWVMLNAQATVIEDIYQDPRIPIDAYKPTFVKSLAMVPIRAETPVGAIGNYWAHKHLPTTEELTILQALANVTSVTMENIDLYGKLQDRLDALKESNKELSRFAWIASHDLKSPLRAIDNLSQWIEEDLADKLDGSTRDYMGTLRGRVRRMEKLLDDILEYAHMDDRRDRSEKQVVDGGTLADDIRALTYIPPGFTLSIAESFQSIRVPRLLLQRIFCNLVDNSVRHHDRKEGLIEIGCEELEDVYIFTVSDDGPGIAPEYRQQVFELLQTLYPRDVREGSGVGLALVKKILTLYGGDITMEPGPARGAVFRFTWPKNLKE